MTDASAAAARWQSCAIIEVVTRTPAIKSFFLRISETFDYTAGQHVDVRLTAPNGHTAMRSYSIASAPSDSKVIDLAIERLADGEVSRSSTTSPKQAIRSSFAGRLADTFSDRGFPTNQCFDRRRLPRRAAHGRDPVSEGKRRASACRAVALLQDL